MYKLADKVRNLIFSHPGLEGALTTDFSLSAGLLIIFPSLFCICDVQADVSNGLQMHLAQLSHVSQMSNTGRSSQRRAVGRLARFFLGSVRIDVLP